MVIKTLEPDWIRIPEMLDPDPYKMDTDPKHSAIAASTGTYKDHKHSHAIYILQAFTQPTRPCFVLLWPLQALTSYNHCCAIFCVNFFLHVESRLESGSNMLIANPNPQKVTNPDPQHIIRWNLGSVVGGEKVERNK